MDPNQKKVLRASGFSDAALRVLEDIVEQAVKEAIEQHCHDCGHAGDE